MMIKDYKLLIKLQGWWLWNWKQKSIDNYANENKTEHNLEWSYIPNHSCRILIIGGSGSEKTNALLNLTNNQPHIEKIYFYAKDRYKANVNS